MTTSSPVRLRIFTLNCWGIPYLTKYYTKRFDMIGDLLCEKRYDIALLQEVWCQKEFHSLKKKLGSIYPHSHYFQSGFIGSGLAVFSKHRIHDAFFYRYSLNGYPYMVHHGDWLGGKGVGKIVLNISGLSVHAFITHFHAEYSSEQDSYLPHRIVQAWELQQFIRHASAGADVVIFGGDLNMRPDDLSAKLLLNYTGLLDCFPEASHTKKYQGYECGFTYRSGNRFANTHVDMRIDYILFKGLGHVDVSCEFLSTFEGIVPGQPETALIVSDHETLTAELLLTPTKKGRGSSDRELFCTPDKLPELINTINSARSELQLGLHCAKRKRHTAARTGIMGLVLLFLELAIAAVPIFGLGDERPFPKFSFYLLGTLCFAVLFFTVLLYIFYSMEVKALQGAEDQMRLAVINLQERLKESPKILSAARLNSPLEGQDPATMEPDN